MLGDTETQVTNEPTTQQPEVNGDVLDLDTARREIAKLRQEAASRRKALEDVQAQQAQREQEALAEQGRWKELAEKRQAELDKLSPYQQRAEQLEATLRAANEARINRLPENMRGLVPTEYAPEKLASWLDTNAALLVRPTPPATDAGAGGSGGGTVIVTDADRAQAAAANANGYANVTAESVAKRRADLEKDKA